jgi:hypothetical protein
MRSKKAGVILVLFSIIFVSGFISAACSSQDQIILRLSSSTNAHGEVYNGAGNYPIEICFDDIFGGVVGTGDRTCTEANKVVGLSSNTNAHVEAPTQDNYPIDICYDDLTCVVRAGSCGVGESLVVSLSSATNAHLADDSSYPTLICCSVGEPPGPDCVLTSAAWSELEVEEGTKVNMRVTGTNCEDEIVSFQIWEDDPVTDDFITSDIPTVSFDGALATGTWVAEYHDDGIGGPEYYFRATAAYKGDIIESPHFTPADPNLLKVTPIEYPYLPCSGIVICADYENEIGCNIDSCDVAVASIPDNIDCSDENINCRCAWEVDSCNATWDGSKGGTCGNGIIDPGEQCDGANWDPIDSCTYFGLADGVLACGSDCNFDTSGCVGNPGSCNDGNINPGETCDGTDWGLITGCSDFNSFNGGSLSCVDCNLDTSLCRGGIGGKVDIGRCVYDEDTTDTCEDGLLTFSWTAAWIWELGKGPADDPEGLAGQCQAEEKTIECPAQIPLPFFGIYNLIAALVIIAIIYGFLIRKNRHKH